MAGPTGAGPTGGSQIGLMRGVAGRSKIDSDTFFSLGTDYAGGIDVRSGVASIPLHGPAGSRPL